MKNGFWSDSASTFWWIYTGVSKVWSGKKKTKKKQRIGTKRYYISHFAIKHLCRMIAMFMLTIRKQNVSGKVASRRTNCKNTSKIVMTRNNFTGEQNYNLRSLTHIIWPQITSQILLTTLYTDYMTLDYVCLEFWCEKHECYFLWFFMRHVGARLHPS